MWAYSTSSSISSSGGWLQPEFYKQTTSRIESRRERTSREGWTKALSEGCVLKGCSECGQKPRREDDLAQPKVRRLN